MIALTDIKILITSGPTWVPIDDTRVISNISTGSLGRIMARDFAKAGATVTLLQGPTFGKVHHPAIKLYSFTFYDELWRLLKKELTKKYDIVIHAAAVSDYQLENPLSHKLSSQLPQLTLHLVPTKKIISLIKKIDPRVFLIGFKLESKMTKALAVKKAQELFQKARCDLVVANSLGKGGYKGFIIHPNGTCLAQVSSRQSLSRALLEKGTATFFQLTEKRRLIR